MTHDEMRTKFGDELMKRIQIKAHDAWNESELEHLGQTSRGTPVWINRLVANASLRVTVGMITAHFVAGYGSGPKTIMPGASGYKTIFHNHGVVSVSPQSKMGITNGNPYWEDMVEVTNLLTPTLAVDVVLNARGEIVTAFHGSPEAAQRAGLRTYNSLYGFRLSEKADIVIASANPMYTYLDQCLKAIIHASMLVKDGGTRIVVSPCEELLGPDYLRKLYYSSLHPKWPTVQEYGEMMRSGKIEDVADALGILKFLESNRSTLTLVCDTSFDDDLSNLGFNHAKSVQVAVEEAMMRHGTDAKAIIVPYGTVTHSVLD
jgi:nickel-dependent lactate racemase